MEDRESPPGRGTMRKVVVGTTALVVLAVWLGLTRPSGHPSVLPSPTRSPTSSYAPSGATLPSTFTIAHVRRRGQMVDIQAYQGPTSSLCVKLATESISCDFALGPGDALHLAYANWLYLDSSGNGFGVFVTGAISAQVASVRVSLGAGRWVAATILNPPSQLGSPFRLFYLEERTGFQSLAHYLPIVALDGHGREIGRISYLVQGG